MQPPLTKRIKITEIEGACLWNVKNRALQKISTYFILFYSKYSLKKLSTNFTAFLPVRNSFFINNVSNLAHYLISLEHHRVCTFTALHCDAV